MSLNSKISMREAISFAAFVVMKSELDLKGDLVWEMTDEQGKVIPGTKRYRKNLVVQTGKEYFASRGMDATTPVMSHFGAGTSTAVANLAQTSLLNQLARVPFTSFTRVGNILTITTNVPAGVATGTIEEIGLFNAAVGGLMVSRALTGGIPKPATMGITFTWNLTVG